MLHIQPFRRLKLWLLFSWIILIWLQNTRNKTILVGNCAYSYCYWCDWSCGSIVLLNIWIPIFWIRFHWNMKDKIIIVGVYCLYAVNCFYYTEVKMFLVFLSNTNIFLKVVTRTKHCLIIIVPPPSSSSHNSVTRPV